MSEPKAHWWNADRFDPTAGAFGLTRQEIQECSADELEAARKRAKLSVLNLTARDKRFLKAMKVAY